MADGFDVRELEKYEKDLLSLAKDKLPKESKKFLKTEGKKLNKENKGTYSSCGIGEISGNLKKGFKVGKVYKYHGSDLSIRAYNSSPHAHLQDLGFVHKSKNGNEKFIPGFHFMEKAQQAFESGYYNDIQDFLDDVLEKGL